MNFKKNVNIILFCTLLLLDFLVFTSIYVYALTFENNFVNNTAPTRLEFVNFAVLISSPPSAMKVIFQWNATQDGIFINVSNATYFNLVTATDKVNFSVNLSISSMPGTKIGWKFGADAPNGSFTYTPLFGPLTVVNIPPPTPTILLPTNDSKTNNIPVQLNVTFPADAENDTISIYYYINGKLNQTSLTNTTLNASDGVYVLNVSLFDGLNFSSNATINFTIDTISPRIFSFNGNVVSNANISQVQIINVTATDNSTGISNLTFSVGNKNFTAIKSNENNWIAGLDTKNFTDGFYNITAAAYDLAGNGEISHVVISEVLFDAVGKDSGRVWVELYNPTNSPINLSGWNIKGGTRIITLPDFIIQKKSTIVMANASNFSRDYGFVPDLDLFQGDFDFTNSNDFVQLRNSSNAIIDEVSWGNNNAGTYNWSLFANENRSITRNPASADSDEQYDWQSNTTATPKTPTNPSFITIFIDNNTAPNAALALPSIKFEEDSYTQIANLSQYFNDTDNDVLTFSYTTNDSNIHATIFQNNTIKINSSLNWNGIANLTIIANDSRLTANQSTIVNVTPVNDAPSAGGGSSSSGSGGVGGGGGGNGGGGALSVCNKDWVCGEWSKCENGQKSRACSFVKVPQHAQNEPCPDESQQPLAKRACEIKKESATNNKVAEKKKEDNKKEGTTPKKEEQKSNGLGAITGAATSNLEKVLSNPKVVKELPIALSIAVTSALGIFGYEFVKRKMKKLHKHL